MGLNCERDLGRWPITLLFVSSSLALVSGTQLRSGQMLGAMGGHECDPLHPLEHGTYKCSAMEKSQTCVMECERGYVIPITQRTVDNKRMRLKDRGIYNCTEEPGGFVWLPSLFFDCVEAVEPEDFNYIYFLTINPAQPCTQGADSAGQRADVRHSLHNTTIEHVCLEAGCVLNISMTCVNGTWETELLFTILYSLEKIDKFLDPFKEALEENIRKDLKLAITGQTTPTIFQYNNTYIDCPRGTVLQMDRTCLAKQTSIVTVLAALACVIILSTILLAFRSEVLLEPDGKTREFYPEGIHGELENLMAKITVAPEIGTTKSRSMSTSGGGDSGSQSSDEHILRARVQKQSVVFDRKATLRNPRLTNARMSVAGLAAARLTGVLQPVVRHTPSTRESKKTELADSDDSAEKESESELLDLPKKNPKWKTDPQPSVAWKWQSVNKRDVDFKKTKSDAIDEEGNEENEQESTKRLKRSMQTSRKVSGKARLESVGNQNGNSTEKSPSKPFEHKPLENRKTERVVNSKYATKAGSGSKSAEKASSIKAGSKSGERTSEEDLSSKPDPGVEDLEEAFDTNVDPDTEQLAGIRDKRKVKSRSRQDSDDEVLSGQLAGSRDKQKVKSRSRQHSDDENARGQQKDDKSRDDDKSLDAFTKRSGADEADDKSTRPLTRGRASQKSESRKPSEKTSESLDAGRAGDVNDLEDLEGHTSDASAGPSEKTRDSDGDQASTSTVRRNRDQDLAFPSYRLKDKDIFWKQNSEDNFWG